MLNKNQVQQVCSPSQVSQPDHMILYTHQVISIKEQVHLLVCETI